MYDVCIQEFRKLFIKSGEEPRLKYSIYGIFVQNEKSQTGTEALTKLGMIS